MQKYTKPNTDKLDKIPNPLANTLQIKVSILKDPHTFKVDGDALIQSSYTVEADPHCRFYTNPEKRLLMNAISPQSKELFLWIIYTIEKSKDYIWINKERYMEELDISSINTYKKSIDELTRYGVIHITTIKDTYWINPEFFFKGSRIDKYPNKII